MSGARSRQRCTTQQPWRCVEIWLEAAPHPDLDAGLDDLLEDLGAVLLRHELQAALDDVVAVGVRGELGDVAVQRLHDHLDHVGLLAHLDEPLHAARAVHVQRGLDDLVLHAAQLR